MTKNLYKARLFAFCVLPDHIHILLSTTEKELSMLIQSFKRNRSWHIRHIINAAEIHESPLRDDVRFTGWQKGFHDEHIQTSRQRANAMRYIKRNALHHHLVGLPYDWPWSSLQFPHLLDEMEIWLE